MSIGIKLDLISHDFALSSGALETVSNEDKTAQDLKTRLRTLKGEFVLDNSYGFPYSRMFDSRVINLSEIESIIKKYILETPNVLEITKFLLEYKKDNIRKLSVVFSVRTISGTIKEIGVTI